VSRRALGLAAVLVLAPACGGASSPAGVASSFAATAEPSRSTVLATDAPSATPNATRSSGPALISMGEHFFDPSLLKISVGTTVIWHNFGEQTHDIHARDGSFNSPLLDQGGTFTFTFNKPGKYPYYCMPHEGDGMFAEIDVE